MISYDIVKSPQTPVSLQGVDSEGNLCNITKKIPLDISVNPGVVEHIHIGQSYSTIEIEEYQALFKEFRVVFSWIYKEMSEIDPSIVIHEIKTTQRPDLLGKNFTRSTQERLRPLKLKLRSF